MELHRRLELMTKLQKEFQTKKHYLSLSEAQSVVIKLNEAATVIREHHEQLELLEDCEITLSSLKRVGRQLNSHNYILEEKSSQSSLP